ncbi:MAG: aminotransferase class I/II-fold pyridoxal phosphate-dependent enzyme [Candidatus Eisenbacteria bacterium]|nr:aminotransferase class I/II-fold pyridoxal phosphate-dependent enzyme [Candidatus Eisenbacteria bacterium]
METKTHAGMSRRERLRQSIAPFMAFFTGPFEELNRDPEVANFAVGNPQEMPLAGYVQALQKHIVPQDKDWFAYKLSEPRSQEAVARGLARRTALAWDPADVAMTNGGFAALAVAIRASVEPGEEVIFLSPPWFFYEELILAAGAEPVRVRLAPPRFDIDFEAIERAITPRTAALIVNSPHNPSGRVHTLDTWTELAEVLRRSAARTGRSITLISDEPYNRILFDGRSFHSPAEVIPKTVVTYSYGKTLLAPGMRIGYIAVPPSFPDRESFRESLMIEQLATGYAFPNALLQHAIEDLETLSIDVGALERRRDRLVPALREIGYETTMPEGTFYVMVRSPIDDDQKFLEVLARQKILVLPGTFVEVPGWFRVSLTASDGMVERALPGFRAARADVR